MKKTERRQLVLSRIKELVPTFKSIKMSWKLVYKELQPMQTTKFQMYSEANNLSDWNNFWNLCKHTKTDITDYMYELHTLDKQIRKLETFLKNKDSCIYPTVSKFHSALPKFSNFLSTSIMNSPTYMHTNDLEKLIAVSIPYPGYTMTMNMTECPLWRKNFNIKKDAKEAGIKDKSPFQLLKIFNPTEELNELYIKTYNSRKKVDERYSVKIHSPFHQTDEMMTFREEDKWVTLINILALTSFDIMCILAQLLVRNVINPNGLRGSVDFLNVNMYQMLLRVDEEYIPLFEEFIKNLELTREGWESIYPKLEIIK